MSQRLKRFAQIAGGSAIICLALGKYFDSRCETSCLQAAAKASGGQLRIDGGNFHWSDDDSDNAGGGSSGVALTPIVLPDVAAIKEIEVVVVSTDVRVKASTTLEARAANYRTNKGWIIQADEGKLILDLRDKGPRRLELSLPAGFNGRVELTTVSGDLSIEEKLDLYQLEINATSGNTKLSSWPKNEFSLNTVSGDFRGSAESASPKHIEIQGVSADIDLEINGTFQTFRSETVSGDVTVKLKGKPEFEYRLHSISGDFSGIPGGATKEGIANREMEGKVGEPKDSRLDFESISGDFKMTL